MNLSRLVLAVLLFGSVSLAFGQGSQPAQSQTAGQDVAPPEPLVWINPANPYSTYIEAAVMDKHTPVEFTTLRNKATEVAALTAIGSQRGSALRAIYLGALNSGNRTDLSLSVSDASTGVIVFAYSCVKNGELSHAFQSAAECLAKHWAKALKKSH